ncbi:hypothetical protein [Rhodovulum steppense]|uniref:Uncharacterized protein n=1 Tax=Rhodovulum steppense TaxID=540251 RepID=A0A4R1YTS4_9RHOB|nr:hypothetical protein [Rhodovulum steppense]TCM84448.1 hypothetical protein EV216_11285 [Rhodovulum steppense]
MHSLTPRSRPARTTRPLGSAKPAPTAASVLQRVADRSAPVGQLARLQGAADRSTIQLKGDFIGDPGGWHCHLIGPRGQEHVKMGNNQGSRKDYYPNRPASVRTALAHLEEVGNDGQPGYTACHAYLTGLL